jgi:predicted amidophosphoribosyltransferase
VRQGQAPDGGGRWAADDAGRWAADDAGPWAVRTAGAWLSGVAAGLAELVLPAACAGCGAERVPLRYGTCAGCVAALEVLCPRVTRPEPPPAGLPPCLALGAYDGVLRQVLLSYKERGRHRLAGPLGVLLATVVAEAVVRVGGGPGSPVLLVAVPSTARAARERQGDHLARLARHAARRLRVAGWPATVARPLRASPRPDSAGLDRAGRAAAAAASLRSRPRPTASLRHASRTATVVVVDDVVTTGATLAAATARLAAAGVPVGAAAVLAATRRHGGPSRKSGNFSG